MSTTSDRLGVQANELSDDLKEMGGIARDAAQARFEKCARMPPNTTNSSETTSTACYATSSNPFASGRSNPY